MNFIMFASVINNIGLLELISLKQLLLRTVLSKHHEANILWYKTQYLMLKSTHIVVEEQPNY